jgi:hypothetical protein
MPKIRDRSPFRRSTPGRWLGFHESKTTGPSPPVIQAGRSLHHGLRLASPTGRRMVHQKIRHYSSEFHSQPGDKPPNIIPVHALVADVSLNHNLVPTSGVVAPPLSMVWSSPRGFSLCAKSPKPGINNARPRKVKQLEPQHNLWFEPPPNIARLSPSSLEESEALKSLGD